MSPRRTYVIQKDMKSSEEFRWLLDLYSGLGMWSEVTKNDVLGIYQQVFISLMWIVLRILGMSCTRSS